LCKNPNIYFFLKIPTTSQPNRLRTCLNTYAKNNKHHKIVKRDQQQHLIAVHKHITKKEFYSKGIKKSHTQKTSGWRFQRLHNHLYINLSPKKLFHDKPNYLSMGAYYLITSKQNETPLKEQYYYDNFIMSSNC
jgi:hypothetical protein